MAEEKEKKGFFARLKAGLAKIDHKFLAGSRFFDV